MIENFITYNLVLNNHPIKGLNESHKKKYLKGLGDLFSHIAPHDKSAKRMYEHLCKELLGYDYPEGWLNSNKMKNARKAQKLCREGFKFFRMNQTFWWDFFRIVFLTEIQLNTYSNQIIAKACTSKSKKYCSEAKTFFITGDSPDISMSSYIEDVKKEYKFNSLPTKKFLVVGTMSAGKSTLINALVGTKVAQVKTTACTSSITSIYNRPFDDGVYYTDKGQIIKLEDGEPDQLKSNVLSIHFNGGLSTHPIVLLDSPGIDYAYDQSHRKQTQNAIDNMYYDSILCVVNAPYFERNGEWETINKVLSVKNKKIIFILNQLDRFNPEDDSIEKSLDQFKNLLKSRKSEVKVIPFSAKASFLLKKELDGKLSRYEEIEITSLKEKLSSIFYDFGMYGTGVCSSEEDYFARSGLTNLETTILNQ